MSTLIERLENATGPDRDLDDAIAFEVGANIPKWDTAAFYTSSIDAALALVPVNHTWWVDGESVNGAGETELPTAHVMPYGGDFRIADRSSGPTPATALCIAALKARQLSSGGSK